MARRCQITGKGTSAGNNRSHSRRATKRTFRVNIIVKKVWNSATGRMEKMKVAASTLRTLTKNMR